MKVTVQYVFETVDDRREFTTEFMKLYRLLPCRLYHSIQRCEHTTFTHIGRTAFIDMFFKTPEDAQRFYDDDTYLDLLSNSHGLVYWKYKCKGLSRGGEFQR